MQFKEITAFIEKIAGERVQKAKKLIQAYHRMQEEAVEKELLKNAVVVVNKNEKLVEIDEYGGGGSNMLQREESKDGSQNIMKVHSPKNQMEVDQSFDNGDQSAAKNTRNEGQIHAQNTSTNNVRIK